MTIEYTIEATQVREPLGEPATVWLTASGAPERLVWRGRRFLVHARPVPWVDRIEWWVLEQRASLDARVPIEQPMWQVQIRALDDGEILLIDLAAGADGKWQVTSIHD